MEEVREAGGAQYSKVAMMSPVNTIVFHDVDTDTTTHAHKRSAHESTTIRSIFGMVIVKCLDIFVVSTN